MKTGFFPALGTPLDNEGHLVTDSFIMHVEDQVTAGAAGLLVLGSMGMQAAVRDSETARIARTAVEAAKGRCPIFVGVMDNSVARVRDRLDDLRGLKIDGVVATVPYYHTVNQEEAYQFFASIADHSPFPVYMYDLPSVTQVAIAPDTALRLSAHRNIRGIKTGDLNTASALQAAAGNDFDVLFSGLDVFDRAYERGAKQLLDGMFACSPRLASSFFACLEQGEQTRAKQILRNIVSLRDVFVEVGVFRGFSYAMNALGYPGRFFPDYTAAQLAEHEQAAIRSCMQRIGLMGPSASLKAL